MIVRALLSLVTLLLVVVAPSTALRAQGEVPTVTKQEVARGKFRELTDRMQKLMVVLQSTEPEDSKLLTAGLQFVQEAKIHEDLANVASLLEQERWDDALTEMGEVR
jgi:cytochrome c556